MAKAQRNDKEKTERLVYVVESPPFAIQPYKRFFMLSTEEAQDVKQQFPQVLVRLATQDERVELSAEINPEDLACLEMR
jgi:hypothetical protein